jgi:hypothetical protein
MRFEAMMTSSIAPTAQDESAPELLPMKVYSALIQYHSDSMDEAATKTTGFFIFDFIQQSTRCRPLAGAKLGHASIALLWQ